MGRCSGHCCKGFPLPKTYEQLRENYLLWIAGKHRDEPEKIVQDIHLIYPMVKTRLDGRFDCKHLADNGDCSIYEDRPTMCRDYPYGSPCQKDGCTMTKVEVA